MPIDNYEQYKRVINQITGRLYMHIYILETKIIIIFFLFFCCVCVWLFIAERHTARHRHRDRERQIQTDRESQTDRQTDRQSEIIGTPPSGED